MLLLIERELWLCFCQWCYVFSITIETSILKIAAEQNTSEKSKYIMAAVGCPHLWAYLLLEDFHQKVFIPPYVTLAQQRVSSWLKVGTPSSSFSEKQSFVVVRNVHARSTSLGFKSLVLLISHCGASGKLLNLFVSCLLPGEIRQLCFYGLRKIDATKTPNSASCIASSQPVPVWMIFFFVFPSMWI